MTTTAVEIKRLLHNLGIMAGDLYQIKKDLDELKAQPGTKHPRQDDEKRMTTTAEKIKVMQAFDDGTQIEFRQRGDIWRACSKDPAWAWDATDYRIKPPDPEPLECWAAKKRNSKIISFWFSDKEEAERYCANLEYEVFLMRQVTPMEGE